MPEVYAEFAKIANILEQHYKDMQAISCTFTAVPQDPGISFILL